MRYRALDSNGDYILGRGPQEFLINIPATVAQAVKTALLLTLGEWFLDTSQGFPYAQQVVGYGTQAAYDLLIKSYVSQVQGVVAIENYSSNLSSKRILTINMTLVTQYGTTQLNNVQVPVLFQFGLTGYGAGPYGVGGFGQ